MLNLVICTDRNNLWGTSVTVLSALERCSTSCNIYVIGVNLTKNDEGNLLTSWAHSNTADVKFFDLSPEMLAPFRATLYLKSKAAYARLFLSDFLQEQDRCIYLDTDLLICVDLNELYETNLKGHIAGCVNDISVRAPNSLALQMYRLKQNFGLQNPEMYFNSGVMLIDLNAWRKHEIGKKSVQIGIEKFDFLDSQDQDVLNISLEGHWLALDVRWNTSQYEAKQYFDNGILHLIGKVKPWHPDYHYLFSDRFFSILDRTAYAGKRPSSSKIAKLLKRIMRDIPTFEMLVLKIQRLLKRSGSASYQQ